MNRLNLRPGCKFQCARAQLAGASTEDIQAGQAERQRSLHPRSCTRIYSDPAAASDGSAASHV
jgi:hypothetical protein